MITLDEAIKHEEEVAIEEDKLCKRYDDASGYTRSHNEEIRTSDAKNCEKCAAEHRQLAEWLKDYKRLLEQEPIDKSAMMSEIYMEGVNMTGEYQGCWVRFKDIEKIVNKYMAESEVKNG